jgi:DNA-binding transcriptional ArsR family regulator
MFSDLHPSVEVRDTSVLIQKPYVEMSRTTEAITLVPSVFVWPHVGVVETAPGAFTINYAAHGFGRVFGTEIGDHGDEVAALLGPSRALVLQLLAEPTTTTAAAHQLALSLGAVSRHLSVLQAAGLASSIRRGREVFYRRTPLGDALVAAPAGGQGEVLSEG